MLGAGVGVTLGVLDGATLGAMVGVTVGVGTLPVTFFHGPHCDAPGVTPWFHHCA